MPDGTWAIFQMFRSMNEMRVKTERYVFLAEQKFFFFVLAVAEIDIDSLVVKMTHSKPTETQRVQSYPEH